MPGLYDPAHAVSKLHIRSSRPGADGCVVRVTPETAGRQYVGFEVQRLATGARLARVEAEQDDLDTAAAVFRLDDGTLGVPTGAAATHSAATSGSRSSAPETAVSSRFAAAYRAELAAFVAGVLDGGPSLCPLEEARAALAVALGRGPVVRGAAPSLDRGGD